MHEYLASFFYPLDISKMKIQVESLKSCEINIFYLVCIGLMLNIIIVHRNKMKKCFCNILRCTQPPYVETAYD